MRPCSVIAGILLATVSGCQSYRPLALDPAVELRKAVARDPECDELRAFSERLLTHSDSAIFEPSDGYTLPEAECVALFFNPELRAARLRAGVVAVSARYAGLWEDPTLSIDAERILRSVDHPWVVGGVLELTIPIFGRKHLERTHAEALSDESLAALAALEWRLLHRLRESWLRWSAQSMRCAVTRELLERLEPLESIVARLAETGEVSRSEARLLRIERITRADELSRLEADEAEQRLALKALIGLVPEAPIELVADLTPPECRAATRDEARAALLARNADLQVMRAAYDASEAALRLEVRKQYPDVTLGPGYGEDEADPRALFRFGLGLPIWNQNRAGIARARAERAATHAEFTAQMERLLSELEIAELRLASARARRTNLLSELVPLVDEQYAEIRRIAELGELDAVLTLESLLRGREAKQALVAVRLDESLAARRVLELLGPTPTPRESDKERRQP
ncbi:MAG: TolC family protein [Planctomycetota bacterium]